VVHRTLTEDDAGGYILSDPVPIDKARTCIIERRDAYAVFEEYEALDEPICVETPAGEVVEIDGVPAYSDLTITVNKEGYLPTLITHRVEGRSILLPSQGQTGVTVLFEKEQASLFERPLDEAAMTNEKDKSFLSVEFNVYSGVFSLDDERHSLGRTTWGFQVARGARAELAGAASAWQGTIDYDQNPELRHLPADLYRVQASYPGASCEAMGLPLNYTIWGLPLAESEQFEVRTLPGHVTSFVGQCVCAPPPSETAVLVDPATCSYEEP
jgi:hypothetical protein